MSASTCAEAYAPTAIFSEGEAVQRLDQSSDAPYPSSETARTVAHGS